jgi:hypothetical protein
MLTARKKEYSSFELSTADGLNPPYAIPIVKNLELEVAQK